MPDGSNAFIPCNRSQFLAVLKNGIANRSNVAGKRIIRNTRPLEII